MKPLYQISSEYQKLVDELEKCEDLTVEQLTLLDSLKDNLEEKAVNIASYIKNLESEEGAVMEAEIKLSERRKKLTNKINGLKEYLKSNLETCGKLKIKSTMFDIQVKSNPCKLTILDNSQVEDIYWKEKVTRTIDNEMIKSDLKNGICLDWAKLEKGTRLEIK